MPKQTPLREACPLDTAVEALGGKWKPLIVYQLRHGTKRFSELQRAIPEATRQMLTQQLRQLEADGIVRRTVHAVVPPRVDYELTPMGKEIEPVLAALEKWGGQVLAYRERGGTSKAPPATGTELGRRAGR
ncbi:MAG: winged helix-turn-helix transcriptional regulator [Bryobacteraceae bacterium]